ncbi:MAG: hypothetical protein GX799_00895 [Crenarchaeota archaeon]|nr:hypothetical protein [Thermoproteota archaeon]
MVGTLYFVGLRISCDASREVFALIFLFISLALIAQIEKKFSWSRALLFCLALCGVILSNQVVAVLGFGVVLFTLIYKLMRSDKNLAAKLFVSCLPVDALFLATYFLSPTVSDYRLIFGFPADPDGWLSLFGYASYPEMLVSEAVFVWYCFGFLLPFAVLTFRRMRNLQMQLWVVLLVAAAFVPMVSPSNMRLLMLLVYPLAFYAAEALTALSGVRWIRLRRPLYAAGLICLVAATAVPSLGFMAAPAESPSPYFAAGFNTHIYQIPSSMLQNTVALSDCEGAQNAVSWLKLNMPEGAVLLSHRAFYGWALPVLGPDQIVMYEYDDPVEVALDATQAGYGEIYLVWWVEGAGWYGLPSVPYVFEEVYSMGRIAVYCYS